MWNKSRAAVASFDCPRCGEPKGQLCRNLRTAAYKAVDRLVLAHKERRVLDGTG